MAAAGGNNCSRILVESAISLCYGFVCRCFQSLIATAHARPFDLHQALAQPFLEGKSAKIVPVKAAKIERALRRYSEALVPIESDLDFDRCIICI